MAIHSGLPKAEAGLLVLLDRRMFPDHTVQYRELLPGRLLHVRIEADPGIDLIVGYQHAWSLPKQTGAKANTRDKLLARRAESWAQLATLLHSLPARNQLLLLGDLNTSFTTEGSLVGRGVCSRQGSHAPDTPTAQDLLRNFDLTVLNSWGVSGRRSCTYLPAGASGHSQIDYAIMRRRLADPPARCTAPHTLPFVPATGMRHLPLLGTMPWPRKPIAKPSAPTLPRKHV